MTRTELIEKIDAGHQTFVFYKGRLTQLKSYTLLYFVAQEPGNDATFVIDFRNVRTRRLRNGDTKLIVRKRNA
jgi:hypothetical protein